MKKQYNAPVVDVLKVLTDTTIAHSCSDVDNDIRAGSDDDIW